MTSIRLKIEESWYASMDCKVQKSGPWVCFYGGHSTGYKLGNHPKNIEPCAHRARTVRAPCAHRATTPPTTAFAPTSCCSLLQFCSITVRQFPFCYFLVLVVSHGVRFRRKASALEICLPKRCGYSRTAADPRQPSVSRVLGGALCCQPFATPFGMT